MVCFTSAVRAALVVALFTALAPAPASAQIVRNFTPRFSTTARGEIYLIGNTLQTCNASVSGCTTARAGTGSLLNNNDFTMIHVDIDLVDPGANSSSADLAIPATATVTWAGLYWGARSTVATRNQVRFRPVGSPAYTTLTATQLDLSGTDFYSSFVDVTSLVQAAGNGTYTVANVQAILGTNTFGGWSLVVVTADSAQPPRNMVVFDGYANVSSTAVTIGVSGFVTPLSGSVNTRLGAVVQEGDLGLTGDAMQLNTTTLSDALNPATNFFNSSISRLGTRLSAKNPDYINQLGFDHDVVNASSILPNGATSATIRLSTSGDQYLPLAVTFSTEVFEPVLQPNSVKTVTDLNGGYVTPGDILEYVIPVANTGNDYADAIILRDVIPTNTNYVPGSLVILSGANAGAKTDASGDDQAEFDSGNNRVVFRVGTGATSAAGGSLAPTESTSIRFRVLIGAATPNGTTISNTATLNFTGRTIGTNYAFSTNTVQATVNLPDLTVAKSHTGSFVRGSTGTYAVSVSNVGFGPTVGTVTMADTLPTGLVPTSASGTGWACAISVQTVTCTRSDALVASASYPDITLQVSVAQSATTPRVNTATVSGGSQQNTGNDSSSDSTTIVSSADLSVAKSGPATATAGANLIYTTVITNNGPSDASAVVVADPTPAGLVFVSNGGNCTTAFPCSLGTVTSGATRTITSTYLVPSGYAGASPITNTASVSSAVADPVAGNDASTATSTVVRTADLATTKLGPASVRPGEQIAYTITVTNNGPSDAASVVLADSPAAGLVFVSNAGACTGPFPCSLGALAAGASKVVTATFLVPSLFTAPDPFVNSATGSSELSDPVAGNNTGTASTTLDQRADLVITKSGPATVVPGASVVYTITATNQGPSDATSVTITDPTPSGLVFTSNSGNCATAFPCAMGTIPAGASRTVTATYQVPASYTSPDPVLNTATISSATAEAAPGDETATAMSSVAASADLSIGKSGPAVVAPGTTLTFTTTITNHGPSDASSVVVSDSTPTGLVFVSTSGDCTTAYPCSLGSIPLGQTRTITTSYTVPSGYTSPDPVVNTATVAAATSDPLSANNSSAASVMLSPSAGLSVVKSGPPTVAPGTSVTYAITVTNHGPSDATSVVLSDSTPSGLSFVSNTGDCTTTFPCNLGTVPAGGVRTVQATFSIPSGYTTPDPVLNTADVTSAVFDPVTDNNTSTTASAVAATAGLSISKVGPPFVVPGRDVVYTTLVTNHGPSNAPTVVVSDPTPSGLTFVSNQLDCTTAFPCSLGTLGVGETRTIRSTFSVPSSYSTPDPVSNTATATSGASTPVSSTYDAPLRARANLSMRKVGPTELTPGQSAVFVLTIVNLGDSDASPVTVADSTPAGLVFVSNSGDCTTAFPCDLGTVAAGTMREIVSTFAVPADYAGPDPMVNTATVSSPVEDPVLDNNTNSASVTVAQSADLALSKTGPSDATPGTNVVYQLVLTNNGPSDAAAVVLDDPAPAGLSFVSNSGDCTTAFPCSLGTVPAGSTRTVTATFAVPPGYTGADPIENQASTSSPTPDPEPANNSATVFASPVTPKADLVLTKTGPANATAGGNVVYLLSVTNNGPSDAASVFVVDPTPDGLVFVSNSGDCTTAFPCDLGNIGLGQTRTVTATFALPSAYTGPDPIENTATILTAVQDPVPGNEGATASSALLRTADLHMTKSGPATVTPGQDVVYTISVTNNGPSDADSVTVSDSTPAGLLFVSNAGDCATAFPCNLGTIPDGQTRTITSTFSVPSSYTSPDPVQNTASVTSSVTEAAPGDEAATASSTLARQANLTTTKTGPSVAVPGTSVEFVVTVANAGPSDAPAVSVTDPTPTGLTFVSNSGDCTAAFPCAFATLPAGASRTITATYSVPAGYTSPNSIVNTATVSSAAADPSPGDESATATVPVQPTASVKITKTGPATVTPGSNVVYTLTTRNDGPSDAVALVVGDPTPTGLSFVSNSGACTGPFPCALGTLPAGGVRTIVATYSIPSGYTSPDPVRNVATAFASTFDPAEETNISFVNSAVTAVAADPADLSVVKSDSGARVNRLENFVYTITVTNNGPFGATDVTAVDTLDPETSLVANTGNCVESPVGTLACALGNLAAGASTSFTVTAHVSQTAPYGSSIENGPCTGSEDLCNRVTVSSAQPDPVAGNNTADEPTNVGVYNRKADLSITKADLNGPIQAGGFATYSISVSNAGPWEATDVRVVDLLDPSMTYVGGTLPCTEYPTGTLSCSLETLPAGTSSSFEVVVHVDPAASTASSLTGPVCPGSEDMCNRASVSSRITDPDPDNNAAEVATDVLPTSTIADLSLLKSDIVLEPAPRNTDVTYGIVVTNAGPNDAEDVVVYDSLDPYMTYVSDTAGGCTVSAVGNPAGARLACPLGTVPAGSSATFDVVVLTARDAPVDGTLQDGDCDGSEDVCNSAVAVTTSADLNIADNQDSEPTDLSLNLNCNDGVLDPGEECDPASAEICNNGIDDDGDLLMDCADPLCAVPGFQSCDASCSLTPPCVPILDDPASITARRIRMHGYFVPTTPVDPTADGFLFVLTNEFGEIYRGRLLPGDLVKTKANGELSRWVFKNRGARTGVGIRDGIFRVGIEQRRDKNGTPTEFAFRFKAYGDISAAIVPRMTSHAYIGDDVASLTADWRGAPGNWRLRRKDYAVTP